MPYLFGGRATAAVQTPSRLMEQVFAARPALEAAVEAGVELELGVSCWGLYVNGPNLQTLASPVIGLADLDKASKTRVDAADLTSSKMSLDNVQLKTRLDKAEADLVVARDPARFDAAVEARASLIEQAHKILGKTEPFVRADGKPASNREIQVQIVTALKPDFKADGKSDDYVLALFEHAVSSGVRADSINTLPARLDAMREKPGDSKNDKELDKDEDDKDKPVNAWRKDLANTKGKK